MWVEFALYAALFMLLTLSMTIQYTIRSTSSSGQRVNTLLNQLRVQVIDHLNGVLMIDLVNDIERSKVQSAVNKIKNESLAKIKRISSNKNFVL